MTWFGSSLSNLKDQITSLTKDVLAEVDEEQEHPRFIPYEKFDRLLKICEEKEDQLCELQQEVELLRNRLGVPTSLADGDSPPPPQGQRCDNSENDLQCTAASSSGFSPQETESKEFETIALSAEEEEPSQNATSSSHFQSTLAYHEEFTQNVPRNSVQDILQALENLDPEEVRKIYKKVLCLRESEKQGCPPTKRSHQHGSEETMSNDSEKSDDSLLNDFEVLKSRGSSSKSSADEFATMSNVVAEAQTGTQMTRSTSTQSEYEFSLVDMATQTIKLPEQISECCELSEDELCAELSDCKEPVKTYIARLVDENRILRQSQRDEQIIKCVERESCLEERFKLKDSSIVKHVNELNTFSRKLENFYSSLSEVSDELVDQDGELNSLYKELKSLRQTTDRLQKENNQLLISVKQSQAGELPEALEREVQRNNTLQAEHERLTQDLTSTSHQLEESQKAISTLNEELEATRWALLCREKTQAAEIEQLKECLSTTNHELEISQNTVQSLNKELESSRQELLFPESQCEIELLKEKLSLTCHELEISQNTIQTLNKKLESSRQELLSRESHNETELLKEKLSSTTHELETTKNRFQTMSAELETTKQELLSRDTLTCTEEISHDLEAAQNTIAILNEELEATRQTLVVREESHLQQMNCLRDKIEVLERETKEYAENVSADRQKQEMLLANLKRELEDRDCQIKVLESECERTQSDSLSKYERLTVLEAENERLKAANEAEGDGMRKRVEQLIDENQKFKLANTEFESVNSILKAIEQKRNSLREKLIQSLPTSVNLDAVLFEYIAEIFRVIEELLDFGDDTQRWRDMASSLSVCCERLAQLRETEEAAQRSEEHVEKLKARIAELELYSSDLAQMNNVIADMEAKLNTLTSERDQVIASLKEKHSENLLYHSELQKVHASYTAEVEKNKECVRVIEESRQKLAENNNVVSELERLREHLIAVEQSHTGELVIAEERIQELQRKLTESEERVHSLTVVQTSVSVRANQMSESLQKEVKTLTQDKEQLSVALQSCRAELQKYIQDVQNLRSALDLFHRNKDSEVFEATEKLQSKINGLEDEKRVLNESLRSLQTSLEMAKKLSNEKQQLSNDLRLKTQTIEELETQLLHLRSELKKAEGKISDLNANVNSENQFKSDLLKNIFVRYVTSNTDSMRTQTLQILSEILDFSIEEKRSLGLPGAIQDGAKDKGSGPCQNNDSLIDEFIRFMEKESDPGEKKRTVETVVGPPNILFSTTSSLPDVMLPTLSQNTVGQNSRYILKDVLQ